MLTHKDSARILAEIVATLRSVQHFSVDEFVNRWPGNDREIKLLVWDAKEFVFHEDKVEFGPMFGYPGHYERKAWDKMAERGRRQRARGTRAHERAEKRLRTAASLAPDKHKEQLEAEADRILLRNALRAAMKKFDKF